MEKEKKQKKKIFQKNFLKMKDKGISVFGFDVFIDWVAILSLSVILVVILFFISFKLNAEVEHKITEYQISEQEVRSVDEEKLQKILDEISFKEAKLEQLGGSAVISETEEVLEEEIDDTE